MAGIRNRGLVSQKSEGIPRALGLMLVLVFVIVVGGVSVVSYLNREATMRVQQTEESGKSIALLSNALEMVPDGEAHRWRTLLNRFAANYPVAELRLYDASDSVLASIKPDEVGTVRPVINTGLTARPDSVRLDWIDELHTGRAQTVARTPVRISGHPSECYLEALFDRGASQPLAGVPLWPLIIALVGCIALIIVYKGLCGELATVARIASSLAQHGENLESNLPELRIATAKDRVASCWNNLVDYATRLEEEVSRSTASAELLDALNRSDGGELADAMTTAPLGVILANAQNEVIYANSLARRYIGWPRDIGASLSLASSEVSPDGARIIEAIQESAVRRGGSAKARDARAECSDGNYYQVRVVPIRNAQQSDRLLTLIQDISQQVRADIAREEFVSQVTHELRTPLTNIRAYTETLSSGMFEDPNVITECYNVITKETRRLSRLIEDILSISQLEVGTMQLVVDEVDFSTLLNEAVRDVRGIAESKNIALNIVMPPKLNRVQGDRDKLAVVINNLLGNALKYTPKDGEVTLTCKQSEKQVQVSVRDSGIGIDPSDHARIFEKFQRANDEAVLAETGTGIGLTTAREIARQHGGDITLMSKKGEGATFTLSMPVKSGSPAPAKAVAC